MVRMQTGISEAIADAGSVLKVPLLLGQNDVLGRNQEKAMAVRLQQLDGEWF